MKTFSKIPENSALKDDKAFDYIDSYQETVTDHSHELTPAKIGRLFFSSGPKWIAILMFIRDKIVGLTGLKTSGKAREREKRVQNFHCEPGEQLGIFRVYDRTNNEVILGEDDKHLNFRISLLLGDLLPNSERNLTITTTVHYNNWFGRLYFMPVKPIHKLIVPAMLKGVIHQIEQENLLQTKQ